LFYMDNELKRCSKCKEYKERDLFSNNPSNKDGKNTHCKSCHSANNRAYHKANLEKVNALHRAWEKANPEKHMLCRAKKRAKQFNLDFNLELEDIHIPTQCPILGIVLEYDNTVTSRDSSPSLDKIQNDKGYVKGNVQVVSNRFNSLKKDATFDELILMGEWAKQQKLNMETA
jgi:hypothetical protein